MMRKLHQVLLVIAAVSAGCVDPVTVSDGTVTIRRQRAGLELSNGSAAPVHYFAVERITAAVVDWVACAGPACRAVEAGATTLLPDSTIVGFSAHAEEAILYWWHAVPDGSGGFRADAIRSLIVPL